MENGDNETEQHVEFRSNQTGQSPELRNLDENQVHTDLNMDMDNIPLLPVAQMKFQTEDEAYNFYNAYAKFFGFSIRRHNNYINRKNQQLIWRIICCSCQGEREKHPRGTPKKPRAQTRFNCEAMIKIELEKSSGLYAITNFVEEHTHELTHPERARFLRSHRVFRPAQITLIKNMSSAGFGATEIFNYFCKEAGGCDKLNFTLKDCENLVQKRRTDLLKKGDGQLIRDYFRKKKLENKSFFYAIQVGEDNEIRNCFWCDAKSRIDYQCFGDAVCFDTTYKTNEYDMPFAPFVGVNNHRQTVIFAGALLTDETTETFVWLFETFLEAMGGKVMETIFTDQAAAICKAISIVFPSAHHRLCIWHIYQNALRNLSHMFTKYDSFGEEFKICIYDAETEEEFFKQWHDFIDTFDLKDDKWLEGIFAVREQWAQVYGRAHFCAGMASTQRSESINNLFKKYFKRKQSLREFMDQFVLAVSLRREKEANADVQTRTSEPILLTKWPPERYARKFYTRKLFNRFQIELKEIFDLTVEEEGDLFKVSSYNGGRVRQVEFSSSDNTVKCSCKKFEFTGILCSHALRVLRNKNVVDLPPQYFLARWSRDAKPDVVVDKSGTILKADTNPILAERYSELSNMVQTVVSMGAVSEKQIQIARLGLKRLIEELETSQKSTEVNDPTLGAAGGENPSPLTGQSIVDHPSDDIIIKAPLCKKKKGEQPGRFKGFYDTMKKRGKGRSQQNKKAGNKGNDGVVETFRKTRQPRQRKGNGGNDGQSTILSSYKGAARQINFSQVE